MDDTEPINMEKKKESLQYFDHEVKKWLGYVKVCRNCGTIMDCISGGIFGKYSSEGVNDGYNTYSCPHCKLELKEVTKREWAENGRFKELVEKP